MKSRAAYRGLTIQFEREEIPVQSMSPKMVPDPGWKYMDKKGHGHFWKGKNLPTLEWIVTGTQWVGDEYDAYEYEIGEYRCRLCGEVIKPGERPATPKPVLGPATYTLTIDGEAFVLSDQQYYDALKELVKILRKATGSETLARRH